MYSETSSSISSSTLIQNSLSIKSSPSKSDINISPSSEGLGIP